MNPENRNMILAITLSMAVLFGWQVFVVGPELEKEAARQQAVAEMQAEEAGKATPQADSASATSSGVTVTESRLADNAPRITIDAPLVSGSISLAGARIDDVMLKGYRETQSEDSPFIQFLQKTSSDLPYFAEFGWAAGSGNQPMPTSDSLWVADRQTLAPGAPVSLSWDNGKGLTFRRTLSINDDYLITVDDSVESRLEAPVTLFPYGLVRRHGTPPTTGIYILHEGALGVFDETLREEDYDDMKDADGGVIDVAPEGAGGWIGITDKYWLAALVPDQSVRINYAFKSLGGGEDRYQ
ncbi:MAG: membrane protein insertase YidC, partial [Candidatus Puniceispirillaceae bacterium]